MNQRSTKGAIIELRGDPHLWETTTTTPGTFERQAYCDGGFMARRTTTNLASLLRSLHASGWLRVGVIACAVVALGLGLLAYAQRPSPNAAQTLIGQRAPTFTLPAAQSGSKLDQPVTFNGAAERPTLLVFFDTLCIHCIAGVQAANATSAASSRPAVDVVYIDSPGENAEITGQFMARLRIDPQVLLDAHGRVATRYSVSYYPTLMLVDSHGIVRNVWIGEPTVDDLRAAIARAS